MIWQRSDLSRRHVRRSLGGGGSAWTKADIRRARHIPLKPLLDNLGYRLEQIKNGNYVVHDLPHEVVIKDHYWICTEDGSAGNSIDFLVKIRGMSFADAIRLLLADTA